MGTDIHECVNFGADPNKNPYLVDLNVVSQGNRWAMMEVFTELDIILVSFTITNLVCFSTSNRKEASGWC